MYERDWGKKVFDKITVLKIKKKKTFFSGVSYLSSFIRLSRLEQTEISTRKKRF